MNLLLFCLPLAVPSTFRPKGPPERGLTKKWFYKPFCRFPSNCSPHRLGPDTCCSLLELNAGDWSNVGRKASDQEGCLRATAIWRQLCGFTRTAASTQTDSIDMINNLESMKGGARPMATSTSLLRHVVFPRADLLHLAPSPPPPCTQPGSSMAFNLAGKIDGKRRRSLRTPDDDMSLRQGYLRDVL